MLPTTYSGNQEPETAIEIIMENHLLYEPTHLKKYAQVNLDQFPQFSG